MYTTYEMAGYAMHPWAMPLFRDPHKWLRDLEQAIADEAEAAEFYRYLEGITPNAEARELIHHATKDEISHHRMLSGLYMRLTGRQPAMTRPVIEKADFGAGVYKAFKDELEAAEHYKGMLLSTHNMAIRDMMFDIMMDEMEHADRFTMITAMDWTEVEND